MRNPVHHGVEYVLHALAGLAACANDVFRVATYEVNNLVLHLVGHCAWHVNLVDDGYDFQIMVDSHIQVRYGLSLHSLCGINNEQCALAGGYASRDLV